jgi:predicted dehydrogenase
MAKMCLLHDKHVLIEKPFCLDVEQAEELINLAEKRGRILMVGHVVRFMPPYQKLKQWIDSKEFGDLKFLSLSRFCGIPNWGQWKDKQVIGSSGGALMDLLIHDIDYAVYVLGVPDEIKSSSFPGKFGNHDYVSAMWKYKEKDVNVKIEGGNIFHSNFPFHAGYIAHFEKASISFSTSKGEVITISNDEIAREVPAGDGGEGYYNEIAYFAGCINSNTMPLECMPESSLQSVKLCYKHL